MFRIRIRIQRIHLFLCHKDPDPLVRGMDLAPDPSILKQKENLDLYSFFYFFFTFYLWKIM